MNNSFDKKVIFVGGIHGVGKTTLCKALSDELSISYYSASQLIARVKKDNVAANKKVMDVDENQNILLEAIDKYVFEDKPYLLDGHFCLIDKNGDITDVPINTFRDLKIMEIFVLVDEVDCIITRLRQRDSNRYPTNLIKEFQEQEINRAYQVAEDIGAKCNIIHAKMDSDEVLEHISNLI